MPEDNTPSQMELLETMHRFRTRFPPLLLPKWKPHISIAAGIADERAAVDGAQQLAMEFSTFEIDLSEGCDVDRDIETETEAGTGAGTSESKAAIYFPGQRLRAGWIQPTVRAHVTSNVVDDFDNNNNNFLAHSNEQYTDGEDLLGYICRKGRQLGGETTTAKFSPHLSIVYFDQDELDDDQRNILEEELNGHFKGRRYMAVNSIFVVSTEGAPGEWRIIKQFPFQ